MSYLEALIEKLRKLNTDVVYCRNRGSGSVPVHYVDDLTAAATVLIAYVDKGAVTEREPQTCAHCGHTGTDVTVYEDHTEDDRRNTPRLLPQCNEALGCRRRIAEREGWKPPRTQVRDTISVNAVGIPDDVLEFVDSEGDTWRRPGSRDEATYDGQLYDWVTTGGGGWSTTEGRLGYTPLRVTKVAPPTNHHEQQGDHHG